MSELIGCRVGMIFQKDPNQTVTNVIIYGLMGDKAWVHLERTGEDQIIDLADVIFGPDIKYENGPEHNFFMKVEDGSWGYWDATERRFLHLASDPTDLEMVGAEEEEDIPTGTTVH